jgi:hypothetical protein
VDCVEDNLIHIQQQSFTIKDLGVAYHFFGFLIHRDEYGIRLSQEQYTKIVLDRFGYMRLSRASFKVSSTECICEPYGLSGIDFAAFVGSAMFLATRTRPDIAYALGVLSRFLSNPKKFYEALVKHLLKYLRGTIDWGLRYPSGKYLRECSEQIPEHTLLYTDADHRGEEKKRNTSCWAIQLHGCLIAWGSRYRLQQ